MKFYQLKSELIQVGVVHNGQDPPSVLSRAVQTVLSEDLPVPSVITFLQALLGLSESVGISHVIDAASKSQLKPDEIVDLLFSSHTNSTIAEHMLFIRTVLKLGAGQNLIVCNGKVCRAPLPYLTSGRQLFSAADRASV